MSAAAKPRGNKAATFGRFSSEMNDSNPNRIVSVNWSVRSTLHLALLVLLPLRMSASDQMVGPLHTRDGKRLVMTSKAPVFLRNNSEARDRRLGELIGFIRKDNLNRARYTPDRYVCTEFAVSLHDRAERAGFRCGLVTVEFERGEGHALNVFQTTDHGLVYVDCTGSRTGEEADLYDTFAYLQRGMPYGRLPLDVGKVDPNHYSYYRKVSSLWAQLDERSAKLESDRSAVEKLFQGVQASEAKVLQLKETAKTAAQADELRRQISIHNRRVEKLNSIQREFNVRVAALNQAREALKCRFLSNSAPVESVETWW